MPKNTPQILGAWSQQDEDRKVLTVTETGSPVRSRIPSIGVARDLISRTDQAFVQDQYRRARLAGLINGAPPYDQNELEDLGLGYLTNVNFLEANAILSQKASAWYELFYEVPTLVTFTPKPGRPEQFFEYGKILDGEFHSLMMDWSGFLPLMDKVRRDADAFGLGVAIWPDDYDWRSKAFSSGSFYYDINAKLDPESIEYFYLQDDDVTAGQLYRWAFDNEDAAQKEGWDLEAVKALLVSVYYNEEQQDDDGKMYSTSLWEDLQARLRNGTWPDQVKEFERVKLVHLFVKEIETGKISKYILSEKRLSIPGRQEPDAFLFASEDSIEKVSNVLWFLPYDCGDGYLKSVRGLASHIESHCDLSNRFLGRVFDAGFVSASLVLQPKSGGDYANAQMIRSGVQTILPPNFDVIQRSTMVPEVGSLIPLRDLSISIMRNNTGVWRQHPEILAEREATKTARQIAEESAREARLEKASTQFDYGYLERFYRETFRRLTRPAYLGSTRDLPGLKEAREFVQKVEARGVPKEIVVDLSAHFVLHVTRAIGLGSWGLKLDITNQLVAASGSFDERGRRNAMRDYVAARVSYANVDRYVGVTNRDAIPSDESSHAFLENNDLREGSAVMAASDQWHVSHIQVHAPLIIEILEAVEAGQIRDPEAILRTLQLAVQHLDEHRGFIAGDKTRQDFVQQTVLLIKRAIPAIQQLSQLVSKMRKQQEKAEAQNAQEMEDARNEVASREDQVKLREIELKAELERLKQESLNAMRRDKTVEQNSINRDRMQGELQLKAERQAAEIELERQKAAQKVGSA